MAGDVERSRKLNPGWPALVLSNWGSPLISPCTVHSPGLFFTRQSTLSNNTVKRVLPCRETTTSLGTIPLFSPQKIQFLKTALRSEETTALPPFKKLVSKKTGSLCWIKLLEIDATVQ